MLSKRLSFKGYSIKEALGRNVDTIKGIIAVISGITVLTGVNWKSFLITLGAAFAGLGVKLLADAVDFYFSEVQVN